jgi:hypothetical protein
MNPEEKRNSVLWYACVALTLFAIGLLSVNTIADFDTGYHIKNGEYILAHKTVPTHDLFSYTAKGNEWVNHYWLSDVIFAAVNTMGGSYGLMLFVALLSAVTYGIVLKTTFLKTQIRWLAYGMVIPYSILTYELWVVRPQSFTYLLTALLVYLLELWRRTKDGRILYGLPLLMLVWGNMHAGVIMGIGIMGLYLIHHILFGEKGKEKKWFVSMATLAMLAPLLNPNGWKTLIYSSIIKQTATDLGVQEWKSLLVYLGSWQAQVFLFLMIIGGTIALYALTRERGVGWRSVRTIDWPAMGLLLTAIILPFISIRHVGFFPILTFPILMRALADIFPRLEEEKGLLKKSVIVFVLLLFFKGALQAWGKELINPHLLPIGAAAFMEQEHVKGPLFNDAAFGGTLIWKNKKEPVFIDGRNDVYRGSVTNDYLTIMQTRSGWQELVNEKYKINTFILWYREPLARTTRNLMDHLQKELGYQLVYWDDASIMLVRPGSQDPGFAEAHVYTLINPFIPASAFPMEERPLVAKEWERAITEAPESYIVQGYLQ